jgi:hypothetical protein
MREDLYGNIKIIYYKETVDVAAGSRYNSRYRGKKPPAGGYGRFGIQENYESLKVQETGLQTMPGRYAVYAFSSHPRPQTSSLALLKRQSPGQRPGQSSLCTRYRTHFGHL